MATEFIGFEICSKDRFFLLASAFDALRNAKEKDAWQSDEYWLSFFDEDARSSFWWPTPEEQQEWSRRWLATPPSKRATDPTLQTPWDFGSMIDAFKSGEYNLLACEQVTESLGHLTFSPHSWPYGGTGCMKALVESFGHLAVKPPDA